MNKIFLITVCALLPLSCAEDIDHTGALSLASGTVDRIENFDSKFIPARNVDVWLPDNYSTDKKYAVFYMHDGQMLYDSTSTWNGQEWGVDETMGRLLHEGNIRNTIVVGIWNTEFRHSEYFPQKPFESLPVVLRDSLLLPGKNKEDQALFKTGIASDKYLEFIVKELKPYIDATYSTRADMKSTFVAGSSMGGLISMYALCEYPEVFYGAACMSTHWIGTFDTLNNPIPLAFSAYLANTLPASGNHKVYFDFGTETLDALYEPHQRRIDSILIKKGYASPNWTTLKFAGEDHSERAWNKRLDVPLTFLLGKEN